MHLNQKQGHYLSGGVGNCVCSNMLIVKTIKFTNNNTSVCFYQIFNVIYYFLWRLKWAKQIGCWKHFACLILIEWACVALCLWPLAGWITIIHNLVLELSWAVGRVHSGDSRRCVSLSVGALWWLKAQIWHESVCLKQCVGLVGMEICAQPSPASL